MKFAVAAPGMPTLLWRSLPTGSDAYDAHYITCELTNTFDNIRQKTGATVVSLHGDNASAMLVGMGRIEAVRPFFICFRIPSECGQPAHQNVRTIAYVAE